MDLGTGAVLRGSIEEETRTTLSHIDQILRAASCTPADVVKCTCHLANIEDFDRFNAVYPDYFPPVRPARTTVESVLWGGIKVGIDVRPEFRRTQNEDLPAAFGQLHGGDMDTLDRYACKFLEYMASVESPASPARKRTSA